MKRVTKYKAIQIELHMEGFTQDDVARQIGRSADYVSKHFSLSGGRTFDLDEAYAILEMLGIPKEKIFEYFPPNGEVPNPMKMVARREAIV